MCVDLGRINSKYDCVLGANLIASTAVIVCVFLDTTTGRKSKRAASTPAKTDGWLRQKEKERMLEEYRQALITGGRQSDSSSFGEAKRLRTGGYQNTDILNVMAMRRGLMFNSRGNGTGRSES